MVSSDKAPQRTWAEEHGVAEDWPTWARLLERCVQRTGYYQHCYPFNWVYQYDGVCPVHPEPFDG